MREDEDNILNYSRRVVDLLATIVSFEVFHFLLSKHGK